MRRPALSAGTSLAQRQAAADLRPMTKTVVNPLTTGNLVVVI